MEKHDPIEGYKDDIINLIGDCTPYERRLILGTIAGLKQVIREEANRKHEWCTFILLRKGW